MHLTIHISAPFPMENVKIDKNLGEWLKISWSFPSKTPGYIQDIFVELIDINGNSFLVERVDPDVNQLNIQEQSMFIDHEVAKVAVWPGNSEGNGTKIYSQL